ncbi:MAG TPA: site-2 protease family protein [Verrucomicrobiae bacterium]
MMGFPVGVQWFFWIMAVFVSGGLWSETRSEWINVALRVPVVFFGILIHELGHALAARQCGYHSSIVLHGFGGVTIIPHAQFSRGQSIWVSAAGPLAGFLLAGITILANLFVKTEYEGFYTIIEMSLFVNIGWTLMNLLPVLPLDGGQIFRELLGPKRLQTACFVSGLVAVLVAAYALKNQRIYMAFLFGYFAWVNFTNSSAEGGVMKG